MATIGLKYVVAALGTYNDQTQTVTHDDGFVVGKAITAGVTMELQDVKLYADDAVAETDKSFRSGAITLGVDDLSQENQSTMLGHQIDATTGVMSAKTSDNAPYFGTGFYATKKVNGVQKYRAFWFPKVQYGEPNETLNTKGDSTAFQTPTMEGTVMQVYDGTWKEEKLCDTEAEAKEWLNTQAKITA